MNKELGIIDLYQNNDLRVDNFKNNVYSSFSMDVNSEIVDVNYEWLDMMEGTVRYIDNILRNPNRFIVNQEEIVNVELAKRITVESIKHLSRHTNYIQKIEDNGDVQPSKILNVQKDESFNTYENRVVYTLILNMIDYISLKKAKLVSKSSSKSNRKCEYNATSKINGEDVNINLVLGTTENNSSENGNKNGMSLEDRIAKLELQIRDLKSSDVYKNLAKLHVARVIPPIKKTNLILKNTNFQYAMKLWDYLQEHVEDDVAKKKENKKYNANMNPEIKGLLDDIFLLNYLVVKSVDTDKQIKDSKKEEAINKITDNMINRIITINPEMPIEQLEKMIGDKLEVIKKEKEASISEIQKIFDSRLQKYINRIENFKF